MKMQTLNYRSTVARLIKVAAAFASPRGANLRRLASELEISYKTITRDKEFLADRIGLELECEITPHPEKRGMIQYRWKARNAATVLPLIQALGRMAI